MLFQLGVFHYLIFLDCWLNSLLYQICCWFFISDCFFLMLYIFTLCFLSLCWSFTELTYSSPKFIEHPSTNVLNSVCDRLLSQFCSVLFLRFCLVLSLGIYFLSPHIGWLFFSFFYALSIYAMSLSSGGVPFCGRCPVRFSDTVSLFTWAWCQWVSLCVLYVPFCCSWALIIVGTLVNVGNLRFTGCDGWPWLP